MTRTADPKKWNWNEIDDAIREVGDLQRQVDQHRVTTEQAVATIKEVYETGKREKAAAIAALVKQIKAGFGARKRELGDAKSKTLAHGTVGTRLVSNVKYDQGLKVADVIARAEKAGFYDVVKVNKSLLTEALKAKGKEALTKCGAYVAQQNRFFVEPTTEIEPVDKRERA